MITRLRSFRFLTLASLALLALPFSSIAGTVQAYLLISGDMKDSIISTDPKERDTLVKGGWKLNGTGILQTAAEKGAVPLHRLARSGKDATDRLLEAGTAKVAGHVKQGFTDEGVLGFVSAEAAPGLLPVHHFSQGNRHFWLIDKQDQAAAEAKGWKSAGVSFWLWPVAAQPASSAKAAAKPTATK